MWFLNLIKKSPKNIKPIVIGHPRTGFTLLISIITEILLLNNQIKNNTKISNFISANDNMLSEKILKILRKYYSEKEIIFNKNFQSLLGGPNWIENRNNKKVVCIRKYIGIKNLGDLTLIITLPIKILDAHSIPHSHGPYKFWTNYNYKFASIRASTGTINSACHSINAIASEYIQKYYPNLSNTETEELRINLAASKLSDMEFFNAMVKPMRENFLELIEFKKKFSIHKWEDIIVNPIEEISKIAKKLNINVSNIQSLKIWEKLKYRNLTQHHKHNYRFGKAYIGDESESLTNTHIEILKQNDFDKIHKELEYKKLEYLNENKYTDFQIKLSSFIKNNKILDNVKDRELYWFSFQKSNLDFSRFPFKLYGWKKYTKLERTNISNENLINNLWEIAECEVEKIYKLVENDL